MCLTSNPEEVSKHYLVKSAGDVTLGDQMIAQGQAAIQIDLERLEKWAEIQ